MRKYLASFFAIASLLSPVVMPLTVYAHTDEVTAQNTTTTDDQKTSATTTTTDDASRGTDEARTTRLDKYKAQLKTKVDDTTKQKLTERCTTAQTAVTKVKDRQETAVKGRSTVYADIVQRLNNLVSALKLRSIDTATLEAQIAELQTKIDAFNAAYDTYKTAVSDTAKMDCKADVTAFKAALEQARSDQKSVVTAAQAVRTYVQETIKPTLVAIKQQLAATKTDSTESNNQTNTTTTQ